MDVRLSPEQEALRDSAAQIVGRLGVRTVQQLEDRERAEKLSAAVRAAGWWELRSESDAGGPWASAVEVAIIAEELGRGLADAPFAGPTMAAELRRLVGAPAGSEVETVVFDDTLQGLATSGDEASPRGVAIDVGACTSGLLTSADGRVARVALAGDRMTVDLTRPSVHVRAEQTSEPLAGATSAFSDDARSRWTALGLALTCADLVGVMRGAVALSTEYAAARRQYGVPVGSFQAVQHLLANALVATEGAHSVTLHAAWAVDALPPSDALAAGAVAKAYCARAAREVCETAIQVHGGIGNTWDCLAHVYLRRALVSTDVLGGIGPNLERVLAQHGIGDTGGLR